MFSKITQFKGGHITGLTFSSTLLHPKIRFLELQFTFIPLCLSGYLMLDSIPYITSKFHTIQWTYSFFITEDIKQSKKTYVTLDSH